MSDPDSNLVTLTWQMIEGLGVPDSPLRRLYLRSAELVDETTSDQLALATMIHRGIAQAFASHYQPRTPLQLQAEAVRNTRELRERFGIDVPDIEFSDSDFELPPESPVELARQLGYNDGGRAVRRVLRRGFPTHPKGSRWEPLTTGEVNYVKAHLSPKTAR